MLLVKNHSTEHNLGNRMKQIGSTNFRKSENSMQVEDLSEDSDSAGSSMSDGSFFDKIDVMQS